MIIFRYSKFPALILKRENTAEVYYYPVFHWSIFWSCFFTAEFLLQHDSLLSHMLALEVDIKSAEWAPDSTLRPCALAEKLWKACLEFFLLHWNVFFTMAKMNKLEVSHSSAYGKESVAGALGDIISVKLVFYAQRSGPDLRKGAVFSSSISGADSVQCRSAPGCDTGTIGGFLWSSIFFLIIRC